MASVQNIIPGTAVQLGNESFARRMQIGSNWTYIRIGMLFGIDYTASISPVSFAFGLCSDPQYPFNSGSGDFIGWRTNYDFTGTTNYYQIAGGGGIRGAFLRKLNGAETTAAPGGSANWFINGTSTRTSEFFMDISRNGSIYACKMWGCGTAATAQINVSRYTCMLDMEREGTQGTSFDTFFTHASPLTGGLDYNSVCVYWSKTYPAMFLSTLHAIRYR